MPDPLRLAILTDLRTQHKVSLRHMAEACGLSGASGRDSVRAWELGTSKPHPTRRPKFAAYLLDTLGLRADRNLFNDVWQILYDEWNWEELSEDEQIWLALVPQPAQPSSPSQPRLTNTSQLKRHQDTQPVFQKMTSLPPGSRIPYQRNPFFVGREDELHTLARSLTVSNHEAHTAIPSIAITGIGGMGKTQLAVEFVYRYAAWFSGGIFWLSCADPATVASEIAMCGGHEHLALHPDFATFTLEEQIRLVQQAWTDDQPRLLIFDNCEDPNTVRQWRPLSGGARVLLTSRRSTWEQNAQMWMLPLAPLPRQRSLELFERHKIATDPSLVAIAAELDDHPLALHLAGSFLACNYDQCSPTLYLRQLREFDECEFGSTSRRLLDHQSFTSSRSSPTGHDQHVIRTFALSFDQLNPSDSLDRVALNLLARLVCLAPGEPVPVSLLTQSMAESELDCAAGFVRLREIGMVDPTGTDQTIRIHRLIVAYLLHVLPNALLDSAQQAIEHALLTVVRPLNACSDHHAVLKLETHLRAVTNAAIPRRDHQTAHLCHVLGRHLCEIEKSQAARHYLELGLAIGEASCGATDLLLAPILHDLGWLVDGFGECQQSLSYHQRALAIREQALGEYHPDTVTSLNYVGTAFHALGMFGEAEQYYRHALAIGEVVLEPQHPHMAPSLNNLGLLLLFRGRYADALPYFSRAMTIYGQSTPMNRVKYAVAVNNMGYGLRKLARYPEARSMLEQALAIRQELYGTHHSYLAISHNHLGRLFHALGRWTTAQSHMEQAVALQRIYAPESPWLANSLSNLGMLLLDQGHVSEAESLIAEGLAMNQRIWGEQHRHTARSLNHYGLLAMANHEYGSAQARFERALALRIQTLGTDHPDTANTTMHLGMSLYHQGQPNQAYDYMAHAVAAHLRTLEPTHPYCARSMLSLGIIEAARGHTTAGKHLAKRAFAAYRSVLGLDHPYTIACHKTLQVSF